MEIKELIDSQTRADDIVVYTDRCVSECNISGWGFSATVKGKVRAEQSGTYQITTPSMKMQI